MAGPAQLQRVIVVGGGPAGSVAALLLARRGVAVELFEQHRFPRDKVCGECLSALGRAVLDRAGLTDAIRQLHPVELTRTLIHPADGPTLDLPLPATMWGVTRHALDRLLLEAAIAAGVHVRQPVRCERVTGGRPAAVAWRDLKSNEVGVAEADWVLIADGKSALLGGTAPPPTGDLGIKTHFTAVTGPRDAIELFAGPDCYGGLAPVEGDLWNAAFSVPAAVVRRHRGNIGGTFAEVIAFNPALKRRLAHASQAGPWIAAPLPRFSVRSDWPSRVVPIGNAAAALEPIGGEGMGLALYSAARAVDAITTADGCSDTKALANQYDALWRTRSAVCRTVAWLTGKRGVADAAANLLTDEERLTGLAMGWMGKATA